jgi:hypothetical protein
LDIEFSEYEVGLLVITLLTTDKTTQSELQMELQGTLVSRCVVQYTVTCAVECGMATKPNLYCRFLTGGWFERDPPSCQHERNALDCYGGFKIRRPF